jgi:hypothetical protein
LKQGVMLRIHGSQPGARKAVETIRDPLEGAAGRPKIPLMEAGLCADCEHVVSLDGLPCPCCGGRERMSLHLALNGLVGRETTGAPMRRRRRRGEERPA